MIKYASLLARKSSGQLIKNCMWANIHVISFIVGEPIQLFCCPVYRYCRGAESLRRWESRVICPSGTKGCLCSSTLIRVCWGVPPQVFLASSGGRTCLTHSKLHISLQSVKIDSALHCQLM